MYYHGDYIVWHKGVHLTKNKMRIAREFVRFVLCCKVSFCYFRLAKTYNLSFSYYLTN